MMLAVIVATGRPIVVQMPAQGMVDDLGFSIDITEGNSAAISLVLDYEQMKIIARAFEDWMFAKAADEGVFDAQ